MTTGITNGTALMKFLTKRYSFAADAFGFCLCITLTSLHGLC